MAILGLVSILLLLLLLRQSVFVLLGSAVAYAHIVWGEGRLTDIAVDAWDAANNDVLLSIPLYLLAGNIMSHGAMAQRLVRVMRAVAGPVPGGLAIATILSCAFFAAVSGSGTVTMLAIGGVMYPALIAAGYSPAFALGALCAGGTLGIVIPPSIPLILYGVMTQTSIAELFLAGIGPGLLLTAMLGAYAMARNLRVRGERWDAEELRAAVATGAWALLMPVVILGGIYSGRFTATESAAIAVIYALAVETLAYRELDLAQLYTIVGETARLLGALSPVLMFALAVNVFLTYQQLPDMLAGWLIARVDSLPVFLLLTNLFLLLVGCVMDIGSAILILAPVLAPLAVAQGMDPVHFGIVMVVNLEIGYLTPPVGLNLIVAMSAFGASFRTVSRSVLPFVVLLLVALGVVCIWPGLSLFLVR
jgi:C4-dicarboxylate transporter DctM subunit